MPNFNNFKSEMESYIASFLLGYENCNGYMEVRNYCSNQIASTSYAATLEEFYELVSIAKDNIYNALNNFVNQGAVIPEETVESLYAEFKNDTMLYLDNFFAPYVNEKDYYEALVLDRNLDVEKITSLEFVNYDEDTEAN